MTSTVLAITALAGFIGAIPVWVALRKPARFRTVYRVYAWFLSMLIFTGAAYSLGHDIGAHRQLEAIVSAVQDDGVFFTFGSLRTLQIDDLLTNNIYAMSAFTAAGVYLIALWLYEQRVARPKRNRT